MQSNVSQEEEYKTPTKRLNYRANMGYFPINSINNESHAVSVIYGLMFSKSIVQYYMDN